MFGLNGYCNKLSSLQYEWEGITRTLNAYLCVTYNANLK